MTVTGLVFLSFGFLLMLVAVVPEVAKKTRGGIFYGWYLVAISGFVMVIATVPIFHAMAVWAVVLERQFGWTRTELGLALTLTRVEGGIMGPAEGYLADRVGTRDDGAHRPDHHGRGIRVFRDDPKSVDVLLRLHRDVVGTGVGQLDAHDDYVEPLVRSTKIGRRGVG